MNEENKNKLFISNRDRGLSVAIFKKEEVDIKGDGNSTKSLSTGNISLTTSAPAGFGITILAIR